MEGGGAERCGLRPVGQPKRSLFSQLSFMVSAGAALRLKGRDLKGTEGNHQEFLMEFLIQTL